MSLVLNRKYKLSSSEKFDEYMKAVGVSLVTRKIGNSVTPVIELTETGGEYTLTSNSTFKNCVLKFRLGEEFEEVTPDGRHVKSVISQEGNRLVHVQRGDKESTIVREFSPEQVKMTLTVDNIVCTRIYKYVQ